MSLHAFDQTVPNKAHRKLKLGIAPGEGGILLKQLNQLVNGGKP